MDNTQKPEIMLSIHSGCHSPRKGSWQIGRTKLWQLDDDDDEVDDDEDEVDNDDDDDDET